MGNNPMRQRSPRSRAGEKRKQALREWIRTSLIGLFTVSFLGVIAIIGEDTRWPLWPLGLGLLIGLLLLPVFFYLGNSSKRAFLLYMTYFAIKVLSLFPLLYAVAALMTNALLIFLMIVSCCVVIFRKSLNDLRAHESSFQLRQETGPLDTDRGLWDISKPLTINARSSAENRKWVTLAMVIAPFGALLGTLLYHYFSDASRLIGSLLLLILVYALSIISGKELAKGMFLKRIEAKIGKPICVK